MAKMESAKPEASDKRCAASVMIARELAMKPPTASAVIMMQQRVRTMTRRRKFFLWVSSCAPFRPSVRWSSQRGWLASAFRDRSESRIISGTTMLTERLCGFVNTERGRDDVRGGVWGVGVREEGTLRGREGGGGSTGAVVGNDVREARNGVCVPSAPFDASHD
jgi:hypothetical protein